MRIRDNANGISPAGSHGGIIGAFLFPHLTLFISQRLCRFHLIFFVGGHLKSISSDLSPPPLVEDPDRFYRSGENIFCSLHRRTHRRDRLSQIRQFPFQDAKHQYPANSTDGGLVALDRY
jgi:hypothetical protein